MVYKKHKNSNPSNYTTHILQQISYIIIIQTKINKKPKQCTPENLQTFFSKFSLEFGYVINNNDKFCIRENVLTVPHRM